MRSGYYHMVLSEKSRPKSAFVSSFVKWEFKRCPFGLAQAPAYFLRLVNEVSSGLSFTFGYLDDILVYSPDMETHLEHLRKLFMKLREADLKLKEGKCNFLKKDIQYLGHIILGKGITPMPEKLACIKDMPPPKTPKEVKQFLGLIGYYRKFVPRFSDLARPLNVLTRKDVPFEWTPICQESFELLKSSLMTEPILMYPDPNHPYVLFTDASKYAWACVFTQEKAHQIEGKEVKILHPITYMSGLFHGSQMNWACLTKEAYAIYMSIKKLAYYLEDADITLRSEHLSLKKFLAKNTLNSKVNNCAIEISCFHITFEYIKGIQNTLADTMSRLINIDPQIQQDSEPEGYEFGYYTFDTLPAMEVSNIETTKETLNKKEENNIDSIGSMDLIGEFHPPTSKGKKYALTIICMLMGYVFCIPLKTKTADEVLQAYIDNVYSKFGGSIKILSDNGTEFKNKIFEQVAKELRVVHKLYTTPYHPALNGRIEGFHAFLKACISKHISLQLEWDDLVPLACAGYNFMPNEHSKESPFFLMFGRDPVVPLNTLLEPKIRYMGNDINIISLETMKNLYEIVATNLKLA